MSAPALVTQLSPVLVQIQARLDEDLALDRLARLAGLSRFHVLRQFRALTGETPKQYVLRLRIERAALRLLLIDPAHELNQTDLCVRVQRTD